MTTEAMNAGPGAEGGSLAAVLASLGIDAVEFAGWAGVGGVDALGTYLTSTGEVTQIYAVSPTAFMLWEQTADNGVRQVVLLPIRRISRVVYSETHMTARLLVEMEADRSSGRFEFRSQTQQNLGAFAQDGAQEGQAASTGEAVFTVERARYVIEAGEVKIAELRRFARALVGAAVS